MIELNAFSHPSAGWCEALYDRKSAQLILYGRALGLSHCEAEDVLHETFVALLKLSAAPDNPDHYCLRAFRNRALNYKRSLLRRILREIESKSWFESNGGGDSRTEEAMRGLGELPAEQREVIVLKIWHHLTFEEIGTLLNLSRNTVAGRYRYGVEKLKKTLKQLTYEPTIITGREETPFPPPAAGFDPSPGEIV